LNNFLFLTKTDTTIGFVSQDASKIDQAKERLPNKHYIRAVNSLRTLQSFTRVPSWHKNRVRRSKRTTFIMPNGHSFRVVKDCEHNLLLDRLKWVYSSSANLSGFEYDKGYVQRVSEVIISSKASSDKGEASSIYRLGQMTIQRIR